MLALKKEEFRIILEYPLDIRRIYGIIVWLKSLGAQRNNLNFITLSRVAEGPAL